MTLRKDVNIKSEILVILRLLGIYVEMAPSGVVIKTSLKLFMAIAGICPVGAWTDTHGA